MLNKFARLSLILATFTLTSAHADDDALSNAFYKRYRDSEKLENEYKDTNPQAYEKQHEKTEAIEQAYGRYLLCKENGSIVSKDCVSH